MKTNVPTFPSSETKLACACVKLSRRFLSLNIIVSASNIEVRVKRYPLSGTVFQIAIAPTTASVQFSSVGRAVFVLSSR